MKCKKCNEVARCQRHFGKYWQFKSRDGEGCERPIPSSDVAERMYREALAKPLETTNK